MKCKQCDFVADDIKHLSIHWELEHPNDYKNINNYLFDTDLKLKSFEVELIESTSMYRHARQSSAHIAERKEDT